MRSIVRPCAAGERRAGPGLLHPDKKQHGPDAWASVSQVGSGFRGGRPSTTGFIGHVAFIGQSWSTNRLLVGAHHRGAGVCWPRGLRNMRATNKRQRGRSTVSRLLATRPRKTPRGQQTAAGITNPLVVTAETAQTELRRPNHPTTTPFVIRDCPVRASSITNRVMVGCPPRKPDPTSRNGPNASGPCRLLSG